MAKKEEDITKRIKKLEETVNKQSTQKIASLSSVLSDLEDQVDYAKQISNYHKLYEDSTEESARNLEKSLKIEKEIAEYKDLANDYAKESNKSAKEEAETQIEILTTQRDQAKQAAQAAQTDSARNKSLRDQADAQSKMTGAQKKAQSILDTRDKISQSIADIEKEIAETTGDNSEMVKNILKEKKKQLKNVQEINDLEIDNLTLSKDQLAAREKLAKIEKEVSDSVGKSLGFLDKMDDTLKGIPVIGGILSKALGVDDLKEKLTKDLTKQIMGMGSTFKTAFADAGGGLSGMAGGIKSIIPMIGTMGATLWASLAPILPILLPIIAAVMLFKKALEIDKEVTAMAKGLGVSKDEAHHVHEELLGIAANTKVIGANTEALGEAYMELANSMGVTQLANKEMAETQVYLKKQIGMSADEASAFQKMSMAGGKSAEQNLAVIQAGVEASTGGLMNYKEVAKDIAKSSKAVQASYKGNIAALTKAVIQAKKFGMTLDKAATAASSLSDFESSIEAEMKANVLTGKNMNLNEARRLELAGDHAGAVEEMMKQAGDYDELLGMEEYQRKAIAEAIGMSAEEMMGAAEHQKNLNTMAKDLGITLDENGRMTEEQMAIALASNNEEAKKLALQQQQSDAQEKMSAFTDKLSAAFTKLMDPIMKLIDPLFEMIEPLIEIVDFLMPAINAAFNFVMQPIKAVMGFLGGIVKIFKGDFLGGLHDIGAAVIGTILKPFTFFYDLIVGFFPSIGKLVDKAVNWMKDKLKGLLPNWALKLLGMGPDDKAKEATAKGETATTGESKSKKLHDAHIAPDGGLMVSGKKGSYELDKNDSVIAGTNLKDTPPGVSSKAVTAKPMAKEKDTSISGKLGELMNSIVSPIENLISGPATATESSEVVALLKELIKKIDQPVQFNIGGKTIQEIDKVISVNRSYTSKENGYGT